DRPRFSQLLILRQIRKKLQIRCQLHSRENSYVLAWLKVIKALTLINISYMKEVSEIRTIFYLWLTPLTYSFSWGALERRNMNASSPSNDWPDLLLISTMNRAFEAALPLLATGIGDKARVAEIRVSL